MSGETFRRVVQAIPAIVFAVFIVAEGGVVFALGVITFGVICMHELYRMMRRARPIDLAGFLALAALCLTALYGTRRQFVLVLVLSLLLAFLLFGLGYQHEWFHGTDRLLVGLAVACTAPLGDLFESLVKRDLGVKDTGRFFGAHGGALDRLDAVLFSIVASYYVSVAVLRG